MMLSETFKKLFVHKTESSALQFFRYFFVGGIAFLFDFASLFIFTEYLHIYYLVSAGLAFIIGTAVNYLISTVWIFNKRTFKKRSLEVAIFIIIGAVGLVMNTLIIWLLTEKAGIYYLASKIISTVIIYSWNFFARKYILYK